MIKLSLPLFQLLISSKISFNRIIKFGYKLKKLFLNNIITIIIKNCMTNISLKKWTNRKFSNFYRKTLNLKLLYKMILLLCIRIELMNRLFRVKAYFLKNCLFLINFNNDWFWEWVGVWFVEAIGKIDVYKKIVKMRL